MNLQKHWYYEKNNFVPVSSIAFIDWMSIKRATGYSINDENKDFVISFEAQPDDGILAWGLNLDAQPDEYFTGLFERTVDGNQSNSWKEGITEAMNLRGQQVDMLIKPTLSLYAPFYVSLRGYGMKVYGTWPGKYDIAKEIDNWVQIYFEGDKFKARIYTRKKPADIVKVHTLDAAPPPHWFLPNGCFRTGAGVTIIPIKIPIMTVYRQKLRITVWWLRIS